jgi:hypothetical protein
MDRGAANGPARSAGPRVQWGRRALRPQRRALRPPTAGPRGAPVPLPAAPRALNAALLLVLTGCPQAVVRFGEADGAAADTGAAAPPPALADLDGWSVAGELPGDGVGGVGPALVAAPSPTGGSALPVAKAPSFILVSRCTDLWPHISSCAQDVHRETGIEMPCPSSRPELGPIH